jgi:ABC-type uncharacterized transport system involved in gliding motility auxiliary subunit
MVKTYATRVEEVLNEYAAHSNGKLTVEVIDPKPDTDDEEWAQKYGVSGVRLAKGEPMYFGIVFIAGTKEVAIPYLDPRREEFLEYDLSEALLSAFKKETPKVGVLSPLPLFGGIQGDPWVLISDLKRTFAVTELGGQEKEIPDDLKVLLVLHPKDLSDDVQYAIDQFLLGGGRLIVAVDPMSRVDLMVSGQARMGGQMPQVASDLPKLFKAWGIEYDKGQMVGDLARATRINAGGADVDYPYFLSLADPDFARSSVITGNLRQMMLGEPGAFSLKEGTGLSFEPLLKTTKDSGTGAAQLAALMPPAELARALKTDGKERVVAGILKGKFKSAFDAAPAGATKPFKKEADAEGSVVLIGDVDFFADQNAVTKMQLGSQVMVQAVNDNLSFVANAVDYLGGSPDLIAIRSRGRISRPFTRVQALQTSAQKRWKDEEEKLTARLTELQKKLNDLQAQRTDGNRLVLTPQQQQAVEGFRAEEREVKTKRREVRKNLREDIESLGHRLIAMNLLIVPALATAFGLSVFTRRSRARREKING